MALDMLFMLNALVWFVLITVLGIKSIVLSLVLILTIAWTAESLIDYGILPDNIPDVIFIYVILLLFTRMIFNRRKHDHSLRLPGLPMFLGFLGVSYLSALLNDIEFLRYLLYVRHFTMFYIFFLGMININMSEIEIKKINKYMVFIFILQIVVATGKWLVFPHTAGQFGQESLTGTYATHGGVFHTLLPLMAMAFIIPAYFTYGKKIFVVLFWSFIWFSMIGQKRAIIFILPLFALYILYIMRGRFKVDFNFVKLFTIVTSVGLAMFLIITVNHTLNREETIGGSFDLQYVLDYAQKYTTGQSTIGNTEYAAGRYAATTAIIDRIRSEPLHLLLGYGAGIGLRTGIVENRFHESFLSFGIEDGITGFVWVVAQIGILGVFFLMAFIFKLFRIVFQSYKSCTDDYWKIFFVGTLGNFGVFAFDFLAYSDSFVTNETLLVTFFYYISICFQYQRIHVHEPVVATVKRRIGFSHPVPARI